MAHPTFLPSPSYDVVTRRFFSFFCRQNFCPTTPSVPSLKIIGHPRLRGSRHTDRFPRLQLPPEIGLDPEVLLIIKVPNSVGLQFAFITGRSHDLGCVTRHDGIWSIKNAY